MRVIETTLEDDLSAISVYFWRQGIRHRVFEERGRQIVELQDPQQADLARELHAAWRDGRLRLVPGPPRDSSRRPAGLAIRLFAGLRRFPGLSVLILLALAVFPFSLGLGEGRLNPVAGALLFLDPAQAMSGAGSAPGWGGWQVWRWLTPIFLHFSVVDVAFNSNIVLDLGRRIEAACGTVAFALLVALVGMASNVAQSVIGASFLFGGLSGVGYGLLGFLLVMARRYPADTRWRLPAGLGAGLLIFLVVFSTGITEPFGLHVANAAHWGGLVTGALLALLWRPRGGPRLFS